MLKCSNCQSALIKDDAWSEWLALMFFMEFLLNEGYIETPTYERMVERIMLFKDYAIEQTERSIKADE